MVRSGIMTGMIPCARRPRPWLAFAAAALAWLPAGCGDEVKPSPPARWTRLTHPGMSYTLTLPGTWEGEAVLEPALGWRFRRRDATAWGAAWVRTLPDPFGNYEQIRQTELRTLHDIDERAIRAAAGQIGVAQTSLLTVGDLAGVDRRGWPIRTRQYSLRLPAANPPLTNQLTHWAATQLEGSGWSDPEGSSAGRAEVLVAVLPLHDAFDRPVRKGQHRQALYAAWAWVPERVDDDVGRLEIREWARALPISTKFATLGEVRDSLAPPATRPRVVVAAVLEGRRNAFTVLERGRIGNAVREAIKSLPTTDVLVEAGWILGCDGRFAGAGDGGEPLSSSADPAFLEELDRRFAATGDEANVCDGNPLLRSAIVGIESLARRWTDADERWLLLIGKSADRSPSPDDPDQAVLEPAVLTRRLAESKPAVTLIGPFASGCSEAAALADAGSAESLRRLLQSLDGQELEYCGNWPTTLLEGWSGRAAAAGGLRLSTTPLPGTLSVFDAAGKPVTADAVRGYTWVPELRALRAGVLVKPRTDAPWTARYEALVEPETVR